MTNQVSVYLVALTLAISFPAAAGQRQAAPSPQPVFRSDSTLALVRFQVFAKDGYLADLDASEIELREDGVPQKIALFEGGKDGRSTVTEVHLLFDCSDSVQKAGKFDPRVFDANILDRFSNARIAIWGFSGNKLKRFTAPTRNSRSLNGAMESVRRMKPGDTPVYSSIVKVVDRLAKADTETVRMIVTVSDGLPFADGSLPRFAVDHAKRAGIALYPALIFSIRSSTTGQRFEWERQLEFLGTGEQSGGRAFEFSGGGEDDLLDRILKGIASEIRCEYVVGYYPVAAEKPRLHRVQVVLKNSARGRVVGGGRELRR